MPVTSVAALQLCRSRLGATVNDVLVSALILAVADWNAAHGRRTKRIRITVPMSGRRADQIAVLGNLSRLTVVTASPLAAGDDIRALVREVASQTRSAKDATGPQVDLLSRALARAWLPSSFKRRLLQVLVKTVGRAVVDTSLLTNLGVTYPLRFGPAVAAQMAFSTSAHMPRGLSVGAITVGDRLQLCLRYRHALFSSEAAGRFALCYSQALGSLARNMPSSAAHP